MADLASELLSSERTRHQVLKICKQVYSELDPSDWVKEGSTHGDRALARLEDNDSVLLIAFAGTSSNDQTASNADREMTGLPWSSDISSSKVHSGFLKAFLDFQDFVRRKVEAAQCKRVIFTGHSRGGAIATLAAAFAKTIQGRRRVDLVTFGAPKAGNAAFRETECKDFGAVLFANTLDLVPTSPVGGEYVHARELFFLDCTFAAVAEFTSGALQQWDEGGMEPRLSPHSMDMYERNLLNLHRDQSLVAVETILRTAGRTLGALAVPVALANPVLGTVLGVAGGALGVFHKEKSKVDTLLHQVECLGQSMQEEFQKLRQEMKKTEELDDLRKQEMLMEAIAKMGRRLDQQGTVSYQATLPLQDYYLKVKASAKLVGISPQKVNILLSALVMDFRVRFTQMSKREDALQEMREDVVQLQEVLKYVPMAARQQPDTCPSVLLPHLKPCIEVALMVQSALLSSGEASIPELHVAIHKCFWELHQVYPEVLTNLDSLLEVERFVRVRCLVQQSAVGLWSEEHGVDEERYKEFQDAVAQVFEGPGGDPGCEAVKASLRKPPYDDIKELYIAVAGATNSGKSTLINSIFGDIILPAAKSAATAIPVVIKYEGRGHIQARLEGEGLEEALLRVAESRGSKLGQWLRKHPVPSIMQHAMESLPAFGEWLACVNQDLRELLSRDAETELKCADWCVHVTIPGARRSYALVDCPGGSEENTRLQQMISYQVKRAQIALLAIPCDGDSLAMGGKWKAEYLGNTKPGFTSVLVFTKAMKLDHPDEADPNNPEAITPKSVKASLQEKGKQEALETMGVRPEPIFFVSALTALAVKLLQDEQHSEELHTRDASPTRRQREVWEGSERPQSEFRSGYFADLLSGELHRRLKEKAQDPRYQNDDFEKWLHETLGTCQKKLAIRCLCRCQRELQEKLVTLEKEDQVKCGRCHSGIRGKKQADVACAVCNRRGTHFSCVSPVCHYHLCEEHSKDSVRLKEQLNGQEHLHRQAKVRHSAVQKMLVSLEKQVQLVSDYLSLQPQVVAVFKFLTDRDLILDELQAGVLDRALHQAWHENRPPQNTHFTTAGLASLKGAVQLWLYNIAKEELEAHVAGRRQLPAGSTPVEHLREPWWVRHQVRTRAALLGAAAATVVATAATGGFAFIGVTLVAGSYTAAGITATGGLIGPGNAQHLVRKLMGGCFMREDLDSLLNDAIRSAIKSMDVESERALNKATSDLKEVKEKLTSWERKRSRVEQAQRMLGKLVTDLILLQERQEEASEQGTSAKTSTTTSSLFHLC